MKYQNMRLTIVTLITLLLASCNTSETKDDIDEATKDVVSDVAETSLDGVWTDGSGPNASFSIEDDSIFDVEHFTATRFDRFNDSVIFYYPDLTVKTKVHKPHEDTLIIESGDVKAVYWRFEH